ncbi:uncharacterized protein LOC144887295 [Branchiostoma floridae x Branchiostoma japonicum]
MSLEETNGTGIASWTSKTSSTPSRIALKQIMKTKRTSKNGSALTSQTAVRSLRCSIQRMRSRLLLCRRRRFWGHFAHDCTLPTRISTMGETVNGTTSSMRQGMKVCE